MSQSLTALLWTPLVTIWKPLAVAVWSSTEDSGEGVRPSPGEGGRGAPEPEASALSPQHPGWQGRV